jgi:hypothetical protein
LKKNKISKLYEKWKILPSKCRGKVQKTKEETLKGIFSNLLKPATHFFRLMWSTLVGWPQHLPAMPKLLLKFSFFHNFWSVGPKIMKFILSWSLIQGACSQEVSKVLQIKWDQVTLPKTTLSPVGTTGPLGVKIYEGIKVRFNFMIQICTNPHLHCKCLHYIAFMQLWSFNLKQGTLGRKMKHTCLIIYWKDQNINNI